MPNDFQKTCQKCLTNYDSALTSFGKLKSSKDGLRSLCRLCRSVAEKESYIKNQAKRLESGRKYREENKETIKENHKRHRENNKENIRQRGIDYRKENSLELNERKRQKRISQLEVFRQREAEARRKNKDKIKQNNKKYYGLNSQAFKQRSNLRRFRADQATPVWCDLALCAAKYAEAKRLTKETGIKHNVDHIDPIAHPLIAGLHLSNNLRVVTETENRRKTNSFTPYRIDINGNLTYFTKEELANA